MHDEYVKNILGREKSLFSQDIEDNQIEIKNKISNSNLLIIGAAGSIGSAFVSQVINFSPKSLHLVDISENNLVEIVRDIRSSNLKPPDDFKTFAIQLGSLEFDTFLKSQFNYDYVLNFAALKHVRSERDPFTTMRMFHTNVLSVQILLEHLSNYDIQNFFSVSTDKSVNPVSVMGATKAYMEKIMIMYSEDTPVSTTRFANVAFSDGSLLYGFHNRIEKNQPISAPSDVKRYFISHEEAGQLCLLACFLANNRDVYIPKLSSNENIYTLSEVATIFLDSKGLRPRLYSSEQEAIEATRSQNDSSKEWPCFFSPSNTTGEKPYEEFFTQEEKVDFDLYHNIGVINCSEIGANERALINNSLKSIHRLRDEGEWSKQDIIEAIRIIFPHLEHNELDKNLDQRM